MENSVGDPVTPTGVNVDGADVAFGEGSNSSYLNQSVYLAPGEKKLVRIDLGQGNFRCPEGQSTTINLKLRYLTAFGIEKTEGSDSGYYVSCNIVRAITSAGNGSNQLTITSSDVLPTMYVGAPYSTALSASGGTPPYIWGNDIGLSWVGIDYLTIDPSGRLWAAANDTARVTVGGTGSFTLMVRDSANNTATKYFHVTSACTPQGQSCSQDSTCCGGSCRTLYTGLSVCECQIEGGECPWEPWDAACCSGLICRNSRCSVPPACSVEDQSCHETSDCCNGLTCIESHYCVTQITFQAVDLEGTPLPNPVVLHYNQRLDFNVILSEGIQPYENYGNSLTGLAMGSDFGITRDANTIYVRGLYAPNGTGSAEIDMRTKNAGKQIGQVARVYVSVVP